MRYAHILSKITGEPWMITEGGMQAVVSLIHAKLDVNAVREGAFKYEGEKLPQMEILDGVAVIPVHGVLGRGLAPIEKSCGATDYLDIEDDLNEAASNKDVKGVILNVDSPGGMVTGVAPLADMIAGYTRKTGKKCVAYTGGTMGSAAYYLSAGASEVVAQRGAMVGSIGTVMTFLDRSRQYEANGIKVEVISSSKLKGTGVPGTSLTESQRAYLEDMVKQSYEDFRGHVSSNRKVDESAMDGRVFSSSTAMKLGLVDSIATDLASVADAIRRGK